MEVHFHHMIHGRHMVTIRHFFTTMMHFIVIMMPTDDCCWMMVHRAMVVMVMIHYFLFGLQEPKGNLQLTDALGYNYLEKIVQSFNVNFCLFHLNEFRASKM